MKNRKLTKRLFSFLTLLAILLPIIALSAHAASSPDTSFRFVFNGSSSFSQTVSGTKTDIGESSAGAAGVTINNLVLSVGHVEFWINNSYGRTITSQNLSLGSNTTGTIYYDMTELGRLSNPATVILFGLPIGTIWICEGVFQP